MSAATIQCSQIAGREYIWTLADLSFMTLDPLETAFRRASPRHAPRPLAPLGAALGLALEVLFAFALAAAFTCGGIAAWALGVVFILYDFAHLVFVGWHARKLFVAAPPAPPAPDVRLAVVIAAYNE